MNPYSKFSSAIMALTLCSMIVSTGCSSSRTGSTATVFTGTMTGAMVVPPAATASTGTFTATLAADESFLDITVTHNITDMTALHLHGPAPVGANGPVIFDLLANGTVTVAGARGGGSLVTIEARFEEIDESFLEDLGNDLTYLQVHSTSFPPGHFRGQLVHAQQGEDVIDVDFTDATMTHIESVPLDQVRLNAADIMVVNNNNHPVDLRTSFNADTGIIEIFGDAVEVSLPDLDGEVIVTTTLPPLGTRTLELGLISALSESAVTGLEMVVSFPGKPDVILQPGIVVPHRSGSILLDYLFTLRQFGGDALAERGDDSLFTTPIVDRFLSDGNAFGRATGAWLLFFISPTVDDPKTPADSRGVDPFPCGLITDGIVICPEDQAAPNSGPRLIMSMGLDDVVPVNDPTNSSQYAFIFDSDGNPNNNFVPDPAFPEDFFQGTDKWYFVTFSPGNGWQLLAVDASGAGNPTRVFTDAKMIIHGNSIVLSVPQDEFVLPNPAFRATAFRHTGDFGQNGDFDVSYHPGLDEPLEPTLAP